MFWIEVLLMLFPLVVLRVAKLRNDSACCSCQH